MRFTPGLRVPTLMGFLAIAMTLAWFPAFGQSLGPNTQRSAVNPNSKLPPILHKVGIDQKLGAQVPLDLPFQDALGHKVTLRKYLDGGNRPAVLSLVYYSCPMLCPRVLDALNTSLRR
jgi:protein SCO1